MSRTGTIARTLAVLAAGTAGAYGAYAVAAWYRYGRPPAAGPEDRDDLLDGFIPAAEVVDRHAIRVGAPAGLTLTAAREADPGASLLARAIFATRARLLGARADAPPPPGGLIAQLEAYGWGVLADVPGEIVMGTVTRPWEADVVFRAVPPAAFAGFDEPGYVKIAFSLRTDPLGPGACRLRTETRVATTDARARRIFRRYWAAFSAGIHLIRPLLLGAARREAERRARENQTI
jgi:hypothetical protein